MAEAKQKAEAILGPVRERAAAAGVACGTCDALSDRPYEAISQAQGVLTHSKIPTLVYR